MGEVEPNGLFRLVELPRLNLGLYPIQKDGKRILKAQSGPVRNLRQDSSHPSDVIGRMCFWHHATLQKVLPEPAQLQLPLGIVTIHVVSRDVVDSHG